MKKLAPIIVFLLSFYGFSQDWQPTYQEALAISKVEDKPLLVVFSGTDWCAPCIKLDKQIFKSAEFVAYADKNYVLYRADFPRKKANQLPNDITGQNTILADKFNSKGYFPLVVVLNKEQNVLGKTSYKKINPTEYISLINNFVK